MSTEARSSLIRLLKREGSLMWLLNSHPNTVQLYGAVTEGKRIGLAFELCNAGTLQSHLYTIAIDVQSGLSSYRRVTGPSALTSMQQLSAVSSLLQAIGFAHAKGVVHRDVKSANVLVHDFNRSSESAAAASEAASSQPPASSSSSSSASPPLLSFKLSDFGSGRALGQFAGLSAFASSRKGVGQSGGTLRWTPPELLSHELSEVDQPVVENSFAVDIYALGLVIGEVYLQQPPYAKLGPLCKDAQLIVAISDPNKVPFEWSALEAISPKLAQLIRACCHRNPQRRPTLAELSYRLWPECMQQMLMRTQLSAPVQPPVVDPAVISASSPVLLSLAGRRAQIESALAVLRQPSAAVRALAQACVDLAALLIDSDGKSIESACSSVVELDGVELLASMMQRLAAGPALLTPAARALARLSSSEFAIYRLLVVTRLVKAMLSAAEQFPLEADLVSCVCLAIGNVCSVDPQGVPMPRTLQMLLKVMHNYASNASVVESACNTIAWLVIDDTREAMTEAGAMEALIRAAKQHPADPGVVAAVCSGLEKLAKGVPTPMEMTERGVISLLQSAMATHAANASVVEAACNTLSTLVIWWSDRVNLFEAGVTTSLIRATQQHPANADIAKLVCAAVSGFALVDGLAHRMVHETDVVGMLLSTLHQHVENAAVTGAVCFALHWLACPHSNCSVLIAAGVISPLLRSLELHAASESRSSIEAFGALSCLAKDAAGCSAIRSQPGALQFLLQLLSLQSRDEGGLTQTIELLHLLTEDNAANRAALIGLGAIEELLTLKKRDPDLRLLDELIASLEKQKNDRS